MELNDGITSCLDIPTYEHEWRKSRFVRSYWHGKAMPTDSEAEVANREFNVHHMDVDI